MRAEPVPAPLADPACLARREADGDTGDAAAFLDGKGVGHVLLEVEGAIGLEGLACDRDAADAVQGKVAHLAAEVVVGGQVPVALQVEDAVGLHGAIDGAASAEAGVADDEPAAPREAVDNVAKDAGSPCAADPGRRTGTAARGRGDDDLFGSRAWILRKAETTSGSKGVPRYCSTTFSAKYSATSSPAVKGMPGSVAVGSVSR